MRLFKWLRELRQERLRTGTIITTLAGFNFCVLRWHEALRKWQDAVTNGDVDAQRQAIIDQQKWYAAEMFWHDQLKNVLGITDESGS